MEVLCALLPNSGELPGAPHPPTPASACRLFAARPTPPPTSPPGQPAAAFPPPMAPIPRPVSTLTPDCLLPLHLGLRPPPHGDRLIREGLADPQPHLRRAWATASECPHPKGLYRPGAASPSLVSCSTAVLAHSRCSVKSACLSGIEGPSPELLRAGRQTELDW